MTVGFRQFSSFSQSKSLEHSLIEHLLITLFMPFCLKLIEIY